MRPATADELLRWDELVVANPDGGNVLQLKAFGETKGEFGWQPHYFIHELDEVTIATLYLGRHVLGIGEVFYCPKGPGVVDKTQLAAVIDQLKASCSAVFVKLEPELARTTDLAGLPLTPVRPIQFNSSTVIIRGLDDPEAVLAGFKQKTRYNIRLAERKGVKVEPVEATEPNLRQMYQLMRATQTRGQFFLREYAYFRRFWLNHIRSGNGQLFVASFEGEVLAGAFITFAGRKALYKDGGSVRDGRGLQAPYLLQWTIMCWLGEHGVTEYDLHGTPPADRLEDAHHPLASLVQFKTGFNAEITEFIGCDDLVLRPGPYRLWRQIGERLTTAWQFRVRHRLFY